MLRRCAAVTSQRRGAPEFERRPSQHDTTFLNRAPLFTATVTKKTTTTTTTRTKTLCSVFVQRSVGVNHHIPVSHLTKEPGGLRRIHRLAKHASPAYRQAAPAGGKEIKKK